MLAITLKQNEKRTAKEIPEYFIICNRSRQLFDEWIQLNVNNLVNGDIRCN